MKFSQRLRRATIVAAVPVAITLVKLAIRGTVHWVWLLEALIHASYLGLFASLATPNRLWDRLPGAHRVLLGSIIVLVLTGQIFQQSRVYFPIVHWGMYCPPAPDKEMGAIFVDALGVTKSGERVDIELVELWPVIRNGFGSRMYLFLRDLQAKTDEATQAELRASGERLISALREKHNEQHPDKPVDSVELVLYRLPARWQGARPEKVEVFRYP